MQNAAWVGCVLALVFAPNMAPAQPVDPATPSSSVLWWTLTDSLAPTDLRKAYADPAASFSRFEKAIALGYASPLDSDQELQFFYHPKLTPELTPLWDAFDVFSRTRYEDLGVADTRSELAAAGLSEEGIQAVLLASAEHSARARGLYEKFAPLQKEFVVLQQRAFALAPPALIREAQGLSEQDLNRASSQEASKIRLTAIAAAVEARDAAWLARATGESQDRLQELLDVWGVNPRALAATTVLPSLRSALAEQDWSMLRRYLLESVASRRGVYLELREEVP